VFDDESVKVMDNWQELYRSQDARDADRLRKREQDQRRNKELSDLFAASPDTRSSEADGADKQLLAALTQGGWLADHCSVDVSNRMEGFCRSMLPPNYTSADIARMKREWSAEQKLQEGEISRLRVSKASSTSSTHPNFSHPPSNAGTASREINVNLVKAGGDLSKDQFDVIVDGVRSEFHLNDKQCKAFKLTTLRLLLTGPGGTGKTHVVKALQAVMRHFHRENEIRMLAPIQKCKSAKSSRVPGHDTEEIVVDVPVTRRDKLRREWRLVSFVLVDEISLMSSQLLLVE